jgi:Zn finger protein HypA/HybF involved in hydrogenase expression
MIGRPKQTRELYCESLTCLRCNQPYMHRFLENQSHINPVCPRCGSHRSVIDKLWKNGHVFTVKTYG